jgi:hypothetical protein
MHVSSQLIVSRFAVGACFGSVSTSTPSTCFASAFVASTDAGSRIVRRASPSAR